MNGVTQLMKGYTFFFFAANGETLLSLLSIQIVQLLFSFIGCNNIRVCFGC